MAEYSRAETGAAAGGGGGQDSGDAGKGPARPPAGRSGDAPYA